MFQVRFHGRGGQGVVTAAEILSVAAFAEGRHAQAFPSFGSERMGAPVVSFCRIDDRPIRTREPVMAPDALVIQDVTLIHQVDLFAGLSPDGYVLVNTSQASTSSGSASSSTSSTATACSPVRRPSSRIEQLGRPLPNAALLGGFAALTGQITLDAIDAAIRERFAGDGRRAQRRRRSAAYRLVTLAERGAHPCSTD